MPLISLPFLFGAGLGGFLLSRLFNQGQQSQQQQQSRFVDPPIDKDPRPGLDYPVPEPEFEDFLTNDILREGFKESRDLFGQGQESQRAAVREALAALEEARTGITGFLGSERERVLETFPEEFFGEERFQQTKNTIFDTIARELESGLQTGAINLSSRGLKGGGSVGTEVGGTLRGAALGAQQQALTDLIGTREEANIAAAQARENLLGRLTGLESGALERLGVLESATKRGDVFDPSQLIDIIGDVTSGQISLDQADKILGFVEEAIRRGESAGEGFQEAIPALLQAVLPSAEKLQATVLALSNLFSPGTPLVGGF